jgi:hypothetical protein
MNATTENPEPAFVPGRVRWWQWLTVLSLDAPLVAGTWQWAVSHAASLPLKPHHAALLGIGVWLAYAADRWIEGWRLTPETVRTQRHYFFLRWRWPAFVIWSVVLIGAVILALRELGAREWFFSLALLGPTLAYLLSHQFLHREHPWRVPKELCVAAILSVGVSLYPAATAPLTLSALLPLLAPTGLFFLLALANCLLISDWEREVDRAQGQTSLALRYRSARALAARLPWAVTALALALALTQEGSPRAVAFCSAVSAALLGWLGLAQARFGRQRARVLADLVLLVPLVLRIAELPTR